jgi:hypothetical protein
MQPFMLLNKKIDFLTAVPSCAIHVKPDGLPAEPGIHLFQHVKESFAISLRPSRQTLASKQGRHPTKEVKTLTMLAGRRDPEPFANTSPTHAQARMEREACFIFENNGFLRAQGLNFFLAPEQTAWLPRCVLANIGSRPALSGIPVGASKIELGALLRIFQNVASGALPRSDHPTERGLIHIRSEAFPSVLPVPAVLGQSNGPAGPVFLPVLKTSAPVRSLCASTNLNSDALSPRLRRSILVADPPVSAKEPLSLSQQGLPGFAESWPLNALDSLRDALPLRWDFSWGNAIIKIALCQFI